jgi:zinc protease
METVNRKIAPAFQTIEKIEFIKANEKKLDNNISVYSVNGGTQDLIKIEFLFAAGMFHQNKTLQAATVNAMLEEGTSNLSSAQIADLIDFYGAFLETNVGQDNASVTLYTLNKHLAATLPVIEKIIKDAQLAQNELDIHLSNKKQKFLVNKQKVANIARKRFVEILFGEKHPYGINVNEDDFEQVNRAELLQFYKTHYAANNCKIIISGKVIDGTFDLLNKYFGGDDWNTNNNAPLLKSLTENTKPVTEIIAKKDALQSAIRIGKTLFNRTHSDYIPMQILNTTLGGYFGSRLMNNIREDKGYTYGIGSGIASLHHGGYFFISTEVGVDVCQSALNEIYFEIEKLQTEQIPNDELELVKNYMLGNFLRSVDGPFAMADRFKGIMEYGLDYSYFEKYIHTIKNTNAKQLQELANTYLQKSSLTELVVGAK